MYIPVGKHSCARDFAAIIDVSCTYDLDVSPGQQKRVKVHDGLAMLGVKARPAERADVNELVGFELGFGL